MLWKGKVKIKVNGQIKYGMNKWLKWQHTTSKTVVSKKAQTNSETLKIENWAKVSTWISPLAVRIAVTNYTWVMASKVTGTSHSTKLFWLECCCTSEHSIVRLAKNVRLLWRPPFIVVLSFCFSICRLIIWDVDCSDSFSVVFKHQYPINPINQRVLNVINHLLTVAAVKMLPTFSNVQEKMEEEPKKCVSSF